MRLACTNLNLEIRRETSHRRDISTERQWLILSTNTDWESRVRAHNQTHYIATHVYCSAKLLKYTLERDPQCLNLTLQGKVLSWSDQFSSVQSLSRVRLFATPWTSACQASLSITNSQSPPKPMSIESVMPSSHLILCRPLLLLPSIFPSFRVFSSESALHIRWPTYWSFSFSISPSNEHSGLISFRMGWLDVQVTYIQEAGPGGLSIGVSASASVLPMNIQDWFPLGWAGWMFRLHISRKLALAAFLCKNPLTMLEPLLSPSCVPGSALSPLAGTAPCVLWQILGTDIIYQEVCSTGGATFDKLLSGTCPVVLESRVRLKATTAKVTNAKASQAPRPTMVGRITAPQVVHILFLNTVSLRINHWFLAVIGLCCCTRAFSGCGGQGQLSSCGVWAYISLRWLLLLWSMGPRAWGLW